MTLPALTNWETTRDSLHKSSLVVSTIAKLGRPRDPKFFHHLALSVIPQGLTTEQTEFGTFTLDFKKQSLIYQPPNGEPHHIMLAMHNQVSLTDALAEKVKAQGFDISPDRSELTDKTSFVINPEHAAGYADVLFVVNNALSTIRAELPDDKTNIVLFPHHFDLSFLWFNGKAEDEHQAHINFGFAAGDEAITRPYFYAYAWDGDAYMNIPVLPPLRHDEKFTTGVVIDYEVLRQSQKPDRVIKHAMLEIKGATVPLWG